MPKGSGCALGKAPHTKRKMKHYPRHIGDYLRDTGHLTLLEHGVYGRLLDIYYAGDGPIQMDFDTLARKLTARSTEERAALQAILAEFFTLSETGAWVNKRCEAILAKYRAFGDQQRSRIQKRYAKTTDGIPTVQESLPTEELPYTAEPTKPETINHKPETNSLLTETKTVAAAPVRASRNSQLPDDWEPTDDHRQIAAIEKKDLAREAANFRDYHRARGNTMKNWNMAFNTWLRNSFNTNKNTPQNDHRSEKRSREFPEQPSSARIWDDI
jgi:hypothetical protein